MGKENIDSGIFFFFFFWLGQNHPKQISIDESSKLNSIAIEDLCLKSFNNTHSNNTPTRSPSQSSTVESSSPPPPISTSPPPPLDLSLTPHFTGGYFAAAPGGFHALPVSRPVFFFDAFARAETMAGHRREMCRFDRTVAGGAVHSDSNSSSVVDFENGLTNRPLDLDLNLPPPPEVA
ncbi:hypothetical protein FEM48_Zijuj12G0106000 [Ziziphus jujuba var. spinosa]|uniref:Uncharacterized protein n=1 Tax=Ziziphus jujuba var. spinosa TaxID=714518 RepID=A0A978UCU1_ZIZJJ|nr:hypothetical protein FEM48_Zijuj12G0106000 [Ziziphus jujuba var. spinosa]